MQVWGTGNVGKQDFDFGEKGNKRIYVRGTRDSHPLRGGHIRFQVSLCMTEKLTLVLAITEPSKRIFVFMHKELKCGFCRLYNFWRKTRFLKASVCRFTDWHIC